MSFVRSKVATQRTRSLFSRVSVRGKASVVGLVGLGNMGQGMAANLLKSAADPKDVRGMCGNIDPNWSL